MLKITLDDLVENIGELKMVEDRDDKDRVADDDDEEENPNEEGVAAVDDVEKVSFLSQIVSKVPTLTTLSDGQTRNVLALITLSMIGLTFLLHIATTVFVDPTKLGEVFETWIPLLFGLAGYVFGYFFSRKNS